MDKETAIQLQTRALNAIKELTSILFETRNVCTEEDYAIIKRGIGLSIGRIQMELLEPINKQYPEIEDLADQ